MMSLVGGGGCIICMIARSAFVYFKNYFWSRTCFAIGVEISSNGGICMSRSFNNRKKRKKNKNKMLKKLEELILLLFIMLDNRLVFRSRLR